MNKYKSIVLYREAIEKNLPHKLFENIKVRMDLYTLLRKIYSPKFNEIVTTYKDFDPYPGYSKYLNVKPWLLDNIWRVYLLGLNAKKHKKNILDIGTGNGYFPYVCKFYGHTVRTIDVPHNPIFNALIEYLEIPRKDYAVKAYESIPAFDIKFDVVTGFHTYFNGHRTQNVWGPNEWDFFLTDLKNNLCNIGAEAFFILNKEHETNSCYTPELLAYFKEKGAEIDDNRVYFSSLEKI
jgi:hypothetical protein